MKKNIETVIEQPEEFPGLRAAVAEQRTAEAALESVLTRREAADYAHATSRAYRINLQQRSAAGDPIPASEVVEAGRAIDEAAAAVAEFPEIVSMAEWALTQTQGAVASAIRRELQRRREVARGNVEAAKAAEMQAARARAAASEAFRESSVRAAFEDEFILNVYADAIEQS